ncbi:MAG: ABC transporter permease [Gemmatimonadota bacterium]
MSAVLNDLRIALRALAKSPAFALITIVTLAVAIGANTAIYSVVDAVLLRPLPYPEADRIVRVAAGVLPQAGGGPEAPFSDRGYWHFVEGNRAFEAFGGYEGGSAQWPLTGDGPPLQLDVALVTLRAFEVLGVQPQRGRWPTQEEDVPDAPLVVLISDGLWADRYGRDPGIVGRTIELNGVSREVIGVMPGDFEFPTPQTDAWAPSRLNPASENFGGHHIVAIARLAPGQTVESATEDAESLIGRFSEVGYGPEWFQGIFSGEAAVRTLKDDIVGDSREPLLILLGTVGFVLLIACSNVANLLLVRAESRTRERAVRIALGSGRGRLVQYVMTESMVLSLAGGAAGVVLAWIGTRVLVAAAPPSIPRLGEIGINGNVLLFTTVVSVVAGLLFGLLPALRAGSARVLAALRDGGRGSTIGRERLHARSVLVVGQVALALVLLVGSGLMVRSFQELRSVDPGFEADGVMTFRLSLPPSKYPNPEATAQFYDQLLERLEAIPGVSAAAGINTLPLTGGGAILTAQIDDHPVPEGEFPPTFLARRAMPGYFSTMGVPLIEGREFTSDDHNARLGSLIISESVKQQFWPNESALGKRITQAGAPARVVGVVGDVHDTGLEVPAEQFVYKPMLDSVGGGVRAMVMTVRTDGDPDALVPAIRAVVGELDSDLPITEIQTMEEILGDSLSRTSFTMTMLLLAAAVALFLGSVGIYGVLSYVASQRTAEMGVRLALGADSGAVRKIILSQGMALAALGVAVGLVGAVALGGVMSSLLYGVSPVDAVTLGAVSLVFMGVAAAASMIPAERAARTPPAVALRAD